MKKLLSVVAIATLGFVSCSKDNKKGDNPGSSEDWTINDIDGGVIITGYKGSDVDIVIPNTVDDKKNIKSRRDY